MKTFLLVSLFVGILSPAAFAKASWKDLSADDFSVSDPPEEGDAVDLADIRAMLKLQAGRTKSECKDIDDMGNADFKDLFKDSGLLSDDDYDNVKKLMKKTGELAKEINQDFKKEFKRPRPADEDSRIEPCSDSDETKDYSYPSSHAMVSTTISCVLSAVYPKRAKDFSGYAHSVGFERVLGGMHHPTDIAAGEKLGYDLCRQLLKDSDYQDKLDELR